MAEDRDDDDDRTETASTKRLEDAKKDGNVARSKELTVLSGLGAGFLAVLLFGPGMMSGFVGQIRTSLAGISHIGAEPSLIMGEAFESALYGCFAVSFPVFLFSILGALISPFITRSWVFLPHLAAPKLNRLSPMGWYKRVFSIAGLFEVAKSFLKMVLVGACVWAAVMPYLPEIPSLIAFAPEPGFAMGASIVVSCLIASICALLVVVLGDVPYQIWHHAKELMMTKQELKDEAKNSDGNPEIKARVRQLQRDASRRRMMSEVPKADVVITNPTHYAVAIAWREGSMAVPRVVARGADAVAMRIKALAQESSVPIVEAPPLARAIYTNADVGDSIPEPLYAAVARVLAYAFALKKYRIVGGQEPLLQEIEFPSEMDPNN